MSESPPIMEVSQMATRTRPADSRECVSDEPAVSGRNLRTLSAAECFCLLEEGGVGRVGFMSPTGIVMLPVNFALAGKSVIFRTAPDTLLAAYGDMQISFEADHLDQARREGWSVLVQGRTHKVTGEAELSRLEHSTCLEPWASGARDVYVRITPVRISGRCIE
jgi:nitroimidazol reductase NimA-like FMN-containing flavoprotein (pyridoxamine 5'-phosphate oxidase superfamily)